MYAVGRGEEKSISVSVVGHKAKCGAKRKKKLCGADDETFVPSHAFKVFTGVCSTGGDLVIDDWFFRCGCRAAPFDRR
jgi:hypothetical protein